jgi:hypothetical protein
MIVSLRHFLGWLVSSFSCRAVSLAKTLGVLSFTSLTMLQACAQVIDFKAGHYFWRVTGENKVKIFSASKGCSTRPQVIYAIKCGATKLTNSRAFTIFVAFQYFGKWRKFPVTR